MILGFFSVSFSLCCSFVVCFPFDYALFFFVTGVCFEGALCFKDVGPILHLLASLGSHMGQAHSRKWKKSQPCIFLLSCPTVHAFDVLFHIFILLLFFAVTITFTKTFSFFFSLTYYWSDFLSSCDFSLSYLFLLVFYLEKTFNICFRMDLVLLNSFTFCLSEKFCVSPSILNVILLGRVS